MHLFRVTLDSAEELELVRNFGGVRYIEETTPIAMMTDSLEEEVLPAIKSPKEGESYPIIGVLDSGIQRNPYLAPWVLGEGVEYYGEELQDKSHGSMVASIVEYSDELNGTTYIDRLVELKKEIMGTVKAVEDVELQALLEKRYLCFLSWEKIAVDMHYSIQHIYRMHDTALAAVEEILPVSVT